MANSVSSSVLVSNAASNLSEDLFAERKEDHPSRGDLLSCYNIEHLIVLFIFDLKLIASSFVPTIVP